MKVGVLVELLSGGDAGVAEDQLRVPGRYAGVLQQRRSGVSQLVHGDLRQPRMVAEAPQGPQQVAALDRVVELRREHQGLVVGRWVLATLFEERVPGGVKQGEIAAAGPGLERSGGEPSVDALHLLPDVQHSLLHVDVTPPQAAKLPAAQPVERQEHERGVEGVSATAVEEGRELLLGPGADLSTLPAGEPHSVCNVAGQQFLFYGTGEGCRKDGALLLHGADGLAGGELIGEEPL